MGTWWGVANIRHRKQINDDVVEKTGNIAV